MGQRTGECQDCGTTVFGGIRGPIPWRCVPCKKKAQARAYDRWAAANPDRVRELDRVYKLRGCFGITHAELDALLAKQGGACALCGAVEPGGSGRWVIDHDHSCCPTKRTCGKCIRGLLCNQCNLGLGQFRDDPKLMRRAADYIESYRR